MTDDGYFRLPIYYDDQKMELKQNIIDDIELVKTIDPSGNSMYAYYFGQCENEHEMCDFYNQVSTYYTTNIGFLKDSQLILKTYIPDQLIVKDGQNTGNGDGDGDIISVQETWKELKLEHEFREKYDFVDFEMLEFLNRTPLFLQLISVYNILSPLIALITPIIILVLPFFLLKIARVQITIDMYINTLKEIAHNHSLGKLFVVDFSKINSAEFIQIMLSAAFYVFSIYRNIKCLLKFRNNMHTIQTQFKNIHSYLNKTINSIVNYLSYTEQLTSTPAYKLFNDNLKQNLRVLTTMRDNINNVLFHTNMDIYKLSNIGKFGTILKLFYELHYDEIYNTAMNYSLDFNKYLNCITGIQQNIKNKRLNFASFTTKNNQLKSTIFKNCYYAPLCEGNPVKNTVSFNKNMIITGPNASGKTTLLKTALINVILTQQFGCGFYDNAKLVPFKYIHCYLNIPDTSGRDSLFQAEARRCKEIIDAIKENEGGHFCIFDELYSGTNPHDSIKSSVLFMKYLLKYSKVVSMLTTHYTKVCDKLDKVDGIENYKMKTKGGNELVYTYKLQKGISRVRGAANILTNLNYPTEIISS